MAKKKQTNDPKAQTRARIARTEAYAEQVRKMFAQTVNDIIALNKSLPVLAEGEMFSFDAQSQKYQTQVETLLRRLHSVATMAIQKGIRLEWAQANAEVDKLVQSVFTKKALETPQLKAYTQRNEAAMAAFIARSERGLNLSQRVWRSCRQLRDEMEVAITVAIGDGTSAATMSRDIRQYLNEPDLMFRRFQYNVKEPVRDDKGNIVYDKNGKPKMQNKLDKDGKPIVRKKWKKKVTDPQTGKVTFIDYDKDSYRNEWTGPGYYKSSAQNAMRVARTETNIAYRRADNERWQQIDFVLGQEVQLAHNHPKKDICDKLAGDYPKDFVFDGWHPQCFCFVTPILVDEAEIVKMNEAALRGETYTPRGKRITDYPQNFKDWVTENADKITAAHDENRDPYFVRNNFDAVQRIMNPDKYKKLTPLELAEQRHANRTPEQEEEIRLRWQQRNERIAAEQAAAEAERQRTARINSTANNVLSVAKSRFADFNIDTSALDIAMQSGDANVINAETRALAKILSQKQQQVKTTASNVINVTKQFKDFDSSADVTALQDALKTGNLSVINKQTRALASSVLDLKNQLKAMSSIIPNAQSLGQSYTVAEIQTAHDAVQSKLATLATLPLDQQIKQIEKELKYVSDPTYLKPHSLYPTWKVSQSAYSEALVKAQHEQKKQQIQTQLSVVKAYASSHPKATALATLVASVEAHLSLDNLADAEFALFDAQKKQKQLEQAQARRDAKKGKASGDTSFVGGTDDYTQARKDAAVWMKDRHDAVDQFFDNAVETWKLATDAERKTCIQYTVGSGYITKFLRGIKGYHESDKTYADRACEDSKLMTSYIARSKSTYDCWIKRDERAAFTSYKFGVDVEKILDNERRKHDIQEQIKYNQKQLAASKLESDKTYYQNNIDDLNKQLSAITTSPTQLLGKVGVDESFMSCGTAKDAWFSGTGGDNKFGLPRVCLNIYCPKGTMWTYADAFNHYTTGCSPTSLWDGKRKNHAGENEIFMQRGTKMRVTKVEYDAAKDLLYLDVDVIEQRCPDMEVEYVASEYGYKAKFK